MAAHMSCASIRSLTTRKYCTPLKHSMFWVRSRLHVMGRSRLFSFLLCNMTGNVRSRFHGTSQHQECSFGSNPAIPPCDRSDCRVCNICRTSFSLEYSAQNGALRMSLRYGRGLYFSATSSKSHDYNGASQKLLRTGDNKRQMFAWRSMFLCSVTIGKPYSTKKGQLPDGMCPPPGTYVRQ